MPRPLEVLLLICHLHHRKTISVGLDVRFDTHKLLKHTSSPLPLAYPNSDRNQLSLTYTKGHKVLKF